LSKTSFLCVTASELKIEIEQPILFSGNIIIYFLDFSVMCLPFVCNWKSESHAHSEISVLSGVMLLHSGGMFFVIVCQR